MLPAAGEIRRTMTSPMFLATFAALLFLQGEPAQPVVAPPPAPAQVPPQVPPQVTPTSPTESATPAVESVLTEPTEPQKRAYIVVDRVSTAAGVIESDDENLIVLRDEKNRLKTFTKNRVISITYLLEGPAGRRVRVVLNDGRVLVGKLVEDGFENVLLEIEGIQTKYARAAVTEVLPYPTDQELYERFRDGLEPDQYTARYTLALWLYNKKMYTDSKRELESLREATNHYEAKQLLIEVNAQLALMAPRPEGETPNKPTKPVDGTELPTRLLTDADVNIIKVYEVELADPPRMQVSVDGIRTLLEKYSDSPLIPAKASEKQAYFSKDPAEIVKTLFALKARELYPEIEVLGEPGSLNLFRQRVHNAWLINNCATSRCHGGPDAGRLMLYNRDFKDDNVRYTNLLILTRSKINTLPLVDFDKPTDSLIFQYALPTTEARRPHPDVRGWTPALTSSRRGLMEDFVAWVRSMRVRDGDYPVDYTPAAMKSPDAPAASGPDR